MLSYEEALQSILETIRPLPPVSMPLDQAAGKVLAETVSARWDLPPADNAAMLEALPFGRRMKCPTI